MRPPPSERGLSHCKLTKSPPTSVTLISPGAPGGSVWKDIQLYMYGGYSNLVSGADPGFGQGGAPASEAESCRHSEAESRERSEHSAAGVQGPLKGPGSFWVFDAQICILTHSTLFLLFLTSILTPKVDKNRALDFTSINLRHSDMLHLFFNLHALIE